MKGGGGAEADDAPGTKEGRGASYGSGCPSGTEIGGGGGGGGGEKVPPERPEADSKFRVTSLFSLSLVSLS